MTLSVRSGPVRGRPCPTAVQGIRRPGPGTQALGPAVAGSTPAAPRAWGATTRLPAGPVTPSRPKNAAPKAAVETRRPLPQATAGSFSARGRELDAGRSPAHSPSGELLRLSMASRPGSQLAVRQTARVAALRRTARRPDFSESRLTLALCHRDRRPVRRRCVCRPGTPAAAVGRDSLRRLGRPGARARTADAVRGPERRFCPWPRAAHPLRRPPRQKCLRRRCAQPGPPPRIPRAALFSRDHPGARLLVTGGKPGTGSRRRKPIA